MGFFDRLTSTFGGDHDHVESGDTDETDRGGKQWDGHKWTVDGVPVTYRVTWKTYDGEFHERDFSDVDQGYSFFEDMQKGATAHSVTWEHLPY